MTQPADMGDSAEAAVIRAAADATARAAATETQQLLDGLRAELDQT